MTVLMERPRTQAVTGVSGDDIDAELEAAFASGSDGALRAAYDRFGRLVFSIALRSLDREAAADVTQEVFVAAWRSRHRYDPERGGLAGWLAAITRNKVVDEIRRRGRTVDTVHGDGFDVVELPHDIAAVADRMLVAEALDTLEDRPRQMVELAFLEGLAHSAIAEVTGMPLGTVKSDIRRGLHRMRRYLDGRHD